MLIKSFLFSIIFSLTAFQSIGQNNSIYIQKDTLMVLNKNGLVITLYTVQVYGTDSISPDLNNDLTTIREITRIIIGKYDCIEICKTKRNEIIYEIEKEIQKSDKMAGKIIHYEIKAIDVDDRLKEAIEKKDGKDPFIK